MKIKKIVLTLSIITAAICGSMFFNPQISYAVPPKINLTPSDYTNGLTWEKAQKIDKPIAVNFYVDWCHFCQGFAPTLDRLNREYGKKYTFVYVNCQDPKNEAVVKLFDIKSYPSLYLFDKKKNKKLKVNNIKFKNNVLLRAEFNNFLK